MGINENALATKYQYVSSSEIAAFYQQFSALDKDGKGKCRIAASNACSAARARLFP
jgi:NADH:ubiquinone oxidoreductase subunit E